MTDLIQRIEAAKEPSVELFREAATTLWGWSCAPGGVDPTFWINRWNRFHARLKAQAWTSAAEMLVPDGWLWSIEPSHHAAHWFAEVWIENRDGSEASSNTAHPSLALLTAILRAERKDDE